MRRDEARRVAVAISRLPELLTVEKALDALEAGEIGEINPAVFGPSCR